MIRGNATIFKTPRDVDIREENETIYLDIFRVTLDLALVTVGLRYSTFTDEKFLFLAHLCRIINVERERANDGPIASNINAV